MARGRWYPTNTTLPNGEVVTMAGRDENGDLMLLPEVWKRKDAVVRASPA